MTSPDTTSIVLGAADTDTATVTGNDAGGPPTGNVTFYECGETATPTPCTSEANEVGSAVTLQDATADSAFAESASFTPNFHRVLVLGGVLLGRLQLLVELGHDDRRVRRRYGCEQFHGERAIELDCFFGRSQQ